MRLKTTSAFVILALAILMTAGAPLSALANSSRAVSKASADLLTLSQQIAQVTLLVALKVDGSENMTKLETHVQSFGERLNALMSGDEQLGLSGKWPPNLSAQLRHIENLSSTLAAIVGESRTAGAISEQQVQEVAGLEVMLRESIDVFQEVYRNSSGSGEVHSLYLRTTDIARQQLALSQQMFKEYLFVAYQLYTADSVKNLNKSYSLLDRSFQALIYGDSEMQLIPAPNPDVERYWNEAREIWIGFRPIIKEAARRGAVDGAQITEVASRNQELLTAMTNAVDAY